MDDGLISSSPDMVLLLKHLGRVANPRPVARIKTGRVSQPITDAADATDRDRSWNATRPWTVELAIISRKYAFDWTVDIC